MPQREGMKGGLLAWLQRQRGWRQMLLVVLVSMPLTWLLLSAWIGVALLLSRSPQNTITGDGALNLVIIVFVAVIGLPLMQRGQYRMFWNKDRAATNLPDDPAASALPTLPPPRVGWSIGLRVRHILMHLAGMAVLIGTFAPFGHQRAIARFLDRFSAGPASRGSLARLVFDYGAMTLFFLLVGLLTYRQLKRRDAGLLDPKQALELEAELNWLFSFGAAFVVGAFLCRWAGSMIIAFL